MNGRVRAGILLIIALLIVGGCGSWAAAQDVPLVRMKDIARVDGVRDNQLYGLGLVIGLEGTGDGTGAQANVQMIANMLERFGITVAAADLRLRNAAAVMVTADVPSSLRSGDRIDVSVASIGDARSLQGGYLLQTPLEAADGQVYAAAQGAVSIGGFNVQGGGTTVQRNHATVGMIPNGAIMEAAIPSSFGQAQNQITLALYRPDFTTAARVTQAINQVFGPNTAFAEDRAAIRVTVPIDYRGNLVRFIAELEDLPVQPDSAARVVINERTGTVVMGANVRIAPIAVAHGNLSVRVETVPSVSQPPPLTGGETVVTDQWSVDVQEDPGRFMVLDSGSSVDRLVEALNAIGASPRDIIAILQAIKAAGALFGELVIL